MMQQQVDRIEAKLDALSLKIDSLDSKIDGHADRITKVETDAAWVKGHIRVAITILVAAVLGAAGFIIDTLGR